MFYQKITKCDTANGDGIRVTLWVSGCNHHCDECHNPQTWNPMSGKVFDDPALIQIIKELRKPWISGLTLSGGDPLHWDNVSVIADLVESVKNRFPDKTIWCYTGYTLEDIIAMTDNNISRIMKHIDILVDGRYRKELKDVSYPWAGSSNQRIWANVNGEWVQSKYEKIYRESLYAKSNTRIPKQE